MDWEGVLTRGADTALQLGLQFGNAYGQFWLNQEQAEAQIELIQQARALAPPMPPASPLLLLILVGVVIVVATRE